MFSRKVNGNNNNNDNDDNYNDGDDMSREFPL